MLTQQRRNFEADQAKGKETLVENPWDKGDWSTWFA